MCLCEAAVYDMGCVGRERVRRLSEKGVREGEVPYLKNKGGRYRGRDERSDGFANMNEGWG